jgi:hypothetical protein
LNGHSKNNNNNINIYVINKICVMPNSDIVIVTDERVAPIETLLHTAADFFFFNQYLRVVIHLASIEMTM